MEAGEDVHWVVRFLLEVFAFIGEGINRVLFLEGSNASEVVCVVSVKYYMLLISARGSGPSPQSLASLSFPFPS